MAGNDDTDNHSRSFLSDLMDPASSSTCPIPQYAYSGRTQFPKDVQQKLEIHQPEFAREWLLVTDIPPRTFQTDFLYSGTEDKSSPFSRVATFDEDLETILLKMTFSRPHEAAVEEFGHALRTATDRLGLKLHPVAGYHSMAGGGKEPDAAWQPRRLPRDRSREWPTAVLEVGFSETRAKLMSDIRHWLGGSNGEVKIVITIDIDGRKPEIIIEQWLGDEHNRPRRRQSVTLSMAASGGNLIISSSPLEIPFEELFLCPPSSPGTETIQLREPALRCLADAVWLSQGFLDRLGEELP